MKRLNLGALTALTLLGAQEASAQGVQFRGVRGEALAGIDRFYSEGRHDDHFAWGGALGVDAFIGDDFVLGVEGTFLNSRAENIGSDGPGIAARKSFEEWGGAVRAGVMATPSTLVYAKAGLVWNEQRKRFDAFNPLGSYYNHYHTRGYVVGGGIEQMLSNHIYVKAEGRYANYRTNSSRLTGLFGVGVLFGPSAAPLPQSPPPPPPPSSPATQTCPDGSVILATEACPPPPPPPSPPPPPPPEPERG